MRSDISYHLYKIILSYGLIPYFICILGFIWSMAYLKYVETVIITKMNQNNFVNILVNLVIIDLVYNLVLGVAKDQFQNRIFIPKFKLCILRYLSDLMIMVDPKYLEIQEKIHKIIPDGVCALENLGLNIINVTGPVFKIIASIIGLGSQIPTNILYPIFGSLFFFFSCGLMVLRSDYIGRKNLQKGVNKHIDIVRNLWETYPIYYLNGLGFNTMKEIEINSLEADRIIQSHRSMMYSFYSILDCLQYTLSAITTYFVIKSSNESNKTVQVFAIFYVINGVYSITWRLFCSVRDTLTATATWGTIEPFIQNYKIRNLNLLIELKDTAKILPHFLNENEVRLYGDSGSGKTTWMSRKVIQLMNIYQDGWLYLDQRMRLPQDLRPIRSVMADYIYQDIDSDTYVKTLFKYASILSIDNLINESTLDIPFEKPSCGEEKRILTLRAFIPILLGLSKVKVIFNDEITAGLDDKNWEKVRLIIEEIKTNYGIKFVTIDHHELSSLTKLIIKKKFIHNNRKIVKSVSGDFISYLSSLYTSGIIKENKTIENKSIEVWIEGLEPEPEPDHFEEF